VQQKTDGFSIIVNWPSFKTNLAPTATTGQSKHSEEPACKAINRRARGQTIHSTSCLQLEGASQQRVAGQQTARQFAPDSDLG
jgi:hypothetical protein